MLFVILFFIYSLILFLTGLHKILSGLIGDSNDHWFLLDYETEVTDGDWNFFFFFFGSSDWNVYLCIFAVIVKASSGPRYVVGCRSKVDKEKLTAGTRVVLDMTTLTIMRALPREVPIMHGIQYLLMGEHWHSNERIWKDSNWSWHVLVGLIPVLPLN